MWMAVIGLRRQGLYWACTIYILNKNCKLNLQIQETNTDINFKVNG